MSERPILLRLMETSQEKQVRVEIRKRSGSYGVVEDYLMHLWAIQFGKGDPMKHREAARRTLDIMKSKAADLALQVADDLGLPWKDPNQGPRGS